MQRCRLRSIDKVHPHSVQLPGITFKVEAPAELFQHLLCSASAVAHHIIERELSDFHTYAQGFLPWHSQWNFFPKDKGKQSRRQAVLMLFGDGAVLVLVGHRPSDLRGDLILIISGGTLSVFHDPPPIFHGPQQISLGGSDYELYTTEGFIKIIHTQYGKKASEIFL